MTELHQAAAAGDLDQVEEILGQNKCNPNQRDIDWCYKTALHWAAANGTRFVLFDTPTGLKYSFHNTHILRLTVP